jgi:hypothetical protein
MTLRDLKISIQNNDIPDTFFIFECAADTFLASTYVNAICEAKQLERTVVDTIFTQDSALSLVMGFENNFRVIYVDTFAEAAEDYSKFVNTAVICKSIDKKIAKLVSEYVIKVAAPKSWQVYDYISKQCHGLSEQDIADLWKAVGQDLHHLHNELDKIKLFDLPQQSKVAYELSLSPGTKLHEMNNFEVVDAIIKKDIQTIKQYLLYSPQSGNEFLGLVSLLINKVKVALFAMYGTKSAEDLGLSSGQFYHAKNNSLGYSQQQLQEKLEFLTSLDLKLKSGLLDIPNKTQINYLIIEMMR